MLVNSKKLLQEARRNGYAIPSPDYFNQTSLRAYIEVAEVLEQPIIIAYSEAFRNILSIEEAAWMGKYYGEKAQVPVVLHVDHGFSEDFVKACIDSGFTSVMIDASSKNLEDNISITKEIVQYAHQKNVTVEAEIGHVGSGKNYENHERTDSIYTEVEDAILFVQQTKVDSLAVSIGTAHGKYKGTPKLNFDRLRELKDAIQVPLVLHGGSSTGDENLKLCSELGIAKINLFTDLVNSGVESMKLANTDDLVELTTASAEGMKKKLSHYSSVFGRKEN